MLSVSIDPFDGFSILEGDAVDLDLVISGTSGSVRYTYELIDDTATSSDYVSLTGSSSFSLFSSVEIERRFPIEIQSNADRVDEPTEIVILRVTLEGAEFDTGGTQKDFDFSIIDDIQQHGTNGKDVFKGVKAADLYNGYGGRDNIKGQGGDDTLNGGNGNDKVYGGGGKDTLNGGNKKDKLFGNNGADDLNGGKGSDVLTGGKGKDEMTGGAGNDRFVFTKGADTVTDFDKNGNDVIDLSKVSNIKNFNDLTKNHLTFVGDDAVIDAKKGNTMLLLDTDMASLTESDFLF